MVSAAALDGLVAWIERRLAEGRPTWSDAEIAADLGLWSIEQARTMLASLADAGRITITGFGADRTIALRAPPRSAAKVERSDPVLAAGTARILAALRRSRPAVAPIIHEEGTDDVPNPPPSDNFRNVNILARDELLDAIQSRASERELSLGKAAISLIEDGLRARATAADDLETCSNDRLLAELARRFADIGASHSEFLSVRAEAASAKAGEDAAIVRAESAEGQLASLRQQIAGLIAG